MPTHDNFKFENPKTLDDLRISSIPQERLADYLRITKYGIEVLGLTKKTFSK
jgi:hypothetical protein